MTAVYESLVLKLAAVLELAQQSEAALTPQSRQALIQATNDFKESLRQARELADALPGGELSVEEQDDVIEMLEQLKARKRKQLDDFSASVDAISAEDSVNMEIDSTASTPS
ncbi:uncharacterized protein FIBRA_08593 [Fibroporia radiculosa]|uniref:Mediator of RNA polymerase II transcription subunit 9 n=1 Tax=Fibroporia radiculosa TaxID=599839 RepID=J4H593_9APHY|nr:uncharacterized protein FIBRA_08593 [Fibroporia radiculosa]CCM06339.1 predicted protein [Fibroporia radiculosa]